MSEAAIAQGRSPLAGLREHPLLLLVVTICAAAVVLAVAEGGRDFAQATVNGVIAGNYYALGAVGLTLIFGVLRLVNFAHGEFLTLGAYFMLAFSGLSLPLVVAVLLALLATAVFSAALELAVWRPVRRRGAGELQLLLFALGLAFVLRNTIAFVAGSQDRQSGANVTASVEVWGLRTGRTELIMTVIGIDRIVLVTWAVSGGLAALAGVVYALPAGTVQPNLGFSLILSVFAAVVVGGIGNAYGALAGGLLIGVVQEWSTLVIEPSVKVAVGFAMLILVLLIRPQGLFGRARTVDR